MPRKRVLFITLSNIGDAILTTPALMAVHHSLPDAIIDVVGDARSLEIFAHCPFRGEAIPKHKKGGAGNLISLVRHLRRTRYELIVDLRTDGLAWLLRARRRLTKFRSRAAGPHAVQQHLAVISRLSSETPSTCTWLSNRLRNKASSLLGNVADGPLLALGPGARWEPKIWPVERFADLVLHLPDRFGATVMLGDAQDRSRCNALEQRLDSPCLNLCGQTGILEAAAVLERCAAFVGNDSGLGHIAAAVGTPTVTVFGPGQPERYHPWSDRSTWLTSPTGRIEDVSVAAVKYALCKLTGA